MRTRLRFLLERLASRGTTAAVLLVVSLLAVITLSGGLIVYISAPESFDSLGEAVWWAALRVSDPGYLADDGSAGRPVALSLILSVSGTAFLVGGVAAIMTQWLQSTLHRLAEGTTAVSCRDHLVVIGWTDRTPRLVAELLGAPARGRVVVLVPEVDERHRAELIRALPVRHSIDRVILRTGTATRTEHLARAGCARARAIIVPEPDASSSSARRHGARWLRSLAALRKALEEAEHTTPPHLVVELGDAGLEPLARSLLPAADFVPSDRIVAAALVRGLRLDEGNGDAKRVLVHGLGDATAELISTLCAQTGIVAEIVITATAAAWMRDPALVEWIDEATQGSAVAIRRLELAPDVGPTADEFDLHSCNRIVITTNRGTDDAERADEESLTVAITLASQWRSRPVHALAVIELLHADSAPIASTPHIVPVVTPAEVARALAAHALAAAAAPD